jgi:pyruvate/2-oxoglutarate dehydrogenase complex dihydrolipoamide acyltransferase (E2) component
MSRATGRRSRGVLAVGALIAALIAGCGGEEPASEPPALGAKATKAGERQPTTGERPAGGKRAERERSTGGAGPTRADLIACAEAANTPEEKQACLPPEPKDTGGPTDAITDEEVLRCARRAKDPAEKLDCLPPEPKPAAPDAPAAAPYDQKTLDCIRGAETYRDKRACVRGTG